MAKEEEKEIERNGGNFLGDRERKREIKLDGKQEVA